MHKAGLMFTKKQHCLIMIRRKLYPVNKNIPSFFLSHNEIIICNMLKK